MRRRRQRGRTGKHSGSKSQTEGRQTEVRERKEEDAEEGGGREGERGGESGGGGGGGGGRRRFLSEAICS